MTLAFMVLSLLGSFVFFSVGDWPVGLLFALLFAVYLAELFTVFTAPLSERVLGLFHTVTGAWLMYLVVAVVVDFTLGYSWPT